MPPRKKKTTPLLASLQGVALVMWFCCAAVVLVFLLCTLPYDPRTSTWGIPGSVAKSLSVGYGPVVATTIAGFLKVILKTFVAVGDTKPMPLVPIRRGATFLYIICLTGVVAAIGIMLLLAFRVIAVPDAELWAGMGAGIWAATTGTIFAKFFGQLAEDQPANAQANNAA